MPTLSTTAAGGKIAGGRTEESGKFHADLVNGLHAMAQPLTILRAAIEVLAKAQDGGIDRRRYLDISTTQIRRTCTLFSHVQDLLTATLNEAQRTPFDLWELLSPMIDDQRSLLQSTGVKIVVTRHDGWERVVGDAERTGQAFVELLKLAASASAPGDVIELLSSDRNGFAEVIIRNGRSRGKRMNSSDRLILSLAEINIVSQHGRCQFTNDPFCVSLALPVEDPGRAGSGAMLAGPHTTLLN